MTASPQALTLADTGPAQPASLNAETPLYPLYQSTEHKRPDSLLSLTQLVGMARSPTISPKGKAAALTPFAAQAKTKEIALESLYHAMAGDHDDDNKSRDAIQATYGPWNTGYLAFTSASHQQDKKGVTANRWKLVIPFSQPVPHERYTVLSQGLALLKSTDAVQARAQQVFYAPNRLNESAPYEFIDATDRPWVDPFDDRHPLIEACLKAYEAETKRQEAKARKAAPKPRPAAVTQGQASIIELTKQAYGGQEAAIIEDHSYKRIGRRWLCPDSTTGTPGVIILNSGKVYSHHGESDPLSNLNHDGHALDVFDLLVALRFNGDFSRAVAELAGELDPQGQKQRQREHMAAKEAAEQAKALAGIEASPTGEKAPAPAIDLLNPPGLAGEVCRLLNATARRPRPELYPLAALHLMALVGRKRESVFTSKLNLMTLAIAPTAAGKEKAQDTTKRLAKLQYCSNLIHGNAGSFKDLIINLLDGDGGNLYIVDEVHSLLDTMKSKNAQTYESKMEAEILTMFGTELYTFRGIEKRDLLNNYQKDSARIEKALDEAAETSPDREKLQRAKEKITRHLDWLENGLPDPFLSLMGHSVPERLDSFIKLDNVTSGFLGRTLVVRCPETREKLRRQPVDGHAVALMESNIEEGLQRIRRSTQTVTPDTEAAAYLNDCVDWYDDDEQLNHHLLGGLYARAPEHLYRIATLLGLEQGTITLAHAQYAHALVKQSLKDVHYILLKAYADSEQAGEKAIIEHARQTIHRQCKGSGEILGRIKQIVTKPKGWQNLQAKDVKRDRLAELLERMTANGELEFIKEGRRERYLSRAVV